MPKKTKVGNGKGITYKEFENGLWVFCLDHAVHNGKFLSVKFGVTDKKDLIRRVMARATGVYKIKNQSEIDKQMEKESKYVSYLISNHKKSSKREKAISNLPEWKQKVILFMRTATKKIIETFIKTNE